MRVHGRKRQVLHAAAREPDYGDLRRLWLDSLVVQLRHQRREPLRTPVAHYSIIVEPDRHRDPDGVYAGAMKLIWDALTPATESPRKPGAGLIPSDTAAHVGACIGWDILYSDRGAAGVYLKLYEPGARPAESIGLQFQGRLPDLNELLKARELGARRSVRHG